MTKSCKIHRKMLSLYLAYFEMFSNVDFLVLSNSQVLNHWFWQMFLIGLIKIKTIWDVRSASSDSRNCQILQLSPGIKQNCSFLNLHNRLCHESSCFWKKLGGIKCKNLVCTTSTWRLGGGQMQNSSSKSMKRLFLFFAKTRFWVVSNTQVLTRKVCEFHQKSRFSTSASSRLRPLNK